MKPLHLSPRSTSPLSTHRVSGDVTVDNTVVFRIERGQKEEELCCAAVHPQRSSLLAVLTNKRLRISDNADGAVATVPLTPVAEASGRLMVGET